VTTESGNFHKKNTKKASYKVSKRFDTITTDYYYRLILPTVTTDYCYRLFLKKHTKS